MKTTISSTMTILNVANQNRSTPQQLLPRTTKWIRQTWITTKSITAINTLLNRHVTINKTQWNKYTELDPSRPIWFDVSIWTWQTHTFPQEGQRPTTQNEQTYMLCSITTGALDCQRACTDHNWTLGEANEKWKTKHVLTTKRLRFVQTYRSGRTNVRWTNSHNQKL